MMRSHDFKIRVTLSPLGMKLMLRVTSAPLEPKFSVIEKCATVLHIFAIGDGDFSPSGREVGGIILLSHWDRSDDNFRPTGSEVKW